MVRVILDMASEPVDATRERARVWCYTVDGDTEETQGTLRDNARGLDIADAIRKWFPDMVEGRPPESAKPLIMVWMNVMNSKRGGYASHSMGYQRLSFEGRYNYAVTKMMDVYRLLEKALAGAKRESDRVREERRKAKEARREVVA